MMTRSDAHFAQGDPAVTQILVFPHSYAQMQFEAAYAKRLELQGLRDVDDNGIGAVYKLRAVLDNKGNYVPLIRCGVTAQFLWECNTTYKTIDLALAECLRHLKLSLLSEF